MRHACAPAMNWSITAGVVVALASVAACSGTVTTQESAAGAGGGSATSSGTGSGSGSGSSTASSGAGSGSASGSSGTGSGSGSSSTSSGSGSGSTSGSSGTASGSGSSGAGAGQASSSSGGPVCDNQGDCGACTSCAWYGPCEAYAQDCLGNAECVAIIECYQSCSFDCNSTCWDPHPQGQADYLKVSICIYCDNCFVDCDSATFGCP